MAARNLLPALALLATACQGGGSGADTLNHEGGAQVPPDESANAPVARLPLPDDFPDGIEAGMPPGLQALAPGDAGARVAPRWLRPGQPVEADAIKERELSGIRLEGEWHWSELPQPYRAPEVSYGGLEAARKLTSLKWTIDLAEPGRMRIRFASRAFPLPHGTELRARADRYGHLLVFADGSRYRALSPGAARTLLGERRADITPLSAPQVGTTLPGTRRFGMATRRTELSTRSGKVSIEQARLPEAGEGGALLCRFFAELVAIDPSTVPCSPGELPLRAQLTWPSGGSIGFEVTSMQLRPDIPSTLLLAPPPSAVHAPTELPTLPPEPLLTPKELAAFRTRPIELGPTTLPGAPSQGLVAVNGTDLLRGLLVDGIPVAWVPPWSEVAVPDLPEGRYVVQWRSFFGDKTEPPSTIELPARITTAGLATTGASNK